MLRSGEDAEQAPEHELEQALRVARCSSATGGCSADTVFEIWEQCHHECAVQAKRRGKRGAPGHQFGVALRQRGRIRFSRACAKPV